MAASTGMVATVSAVAPPAVRNASVMSSSAAFGSSIVQFSPLRSSNLEGNMQVARASLSEENKPVRRQVLNALLAAGVAISLSGQAFAASGPGIDGAERTARKADELLKGADSLIKNDSPPRFGPDRGVGGSVAEDVDRFSQKAGSGAISEIQDATSSAVGEARANVVAKVQESRQRIDGIFGKDKGLNLKNFLAAKVEEAKKALPN